VRESKRKRKEGKRERGKEPGNTRGLREREEEGDCLERSSVRVCVCEREREREKRGRREREKRERRESEGREREKKMGDHAHTRAYGKLGRQGESESESDARSYMRGQREMRSLRSHLSILSNPLISQISCLSDLIDYIKMRSKR